MVLQDIQKDYHQIFGELSSVLVASLARAHRLVIDGHRGLRGAWRGVSPAARDGCTLWMVAKSISHHLRNGGLMVPL